MAAEVSRVLRGAGIRAVLTGGACAVIHSKGEYQSEDVDLIIQGASSREELDDAMQSAGFRRVVDRYVHSRTSIFVEFLRGPLTIGGDIDIRPVELRVGKMRITGLSATDSCRDRLAAFFYWNDRQSLETAVAIAARNRVNLKKIRVWSVKENSLERFDEFLRELKVAKGAKRSSHKPRMR